MGSLHFAEAMKLRLGACSVHPCAFCLKARHSASPADVPRTDSEGVHAMTCEHNPLHHARHNQIVRALEHVHWTCGRPTVRETPHLFGGGARNQRPADLQSGDVVIDVSVSMPSAVSFRDAAAKKPLSAALGREKIKRNKYEYNCRAHNLLFQPFVLEVFGAFGREASKLLTTLARFAEVHDRHLDERVALLFRQQFQQSISVALQSANADVLISVKPQQMFHRDIDLELLAVPLLGA
jgi:hypothetical protein